MDADSRGSGSDDLDPGGQPISKTRCEPPECSSDLFQISDQDSDPIKYSDFNSKAIHFNLLLFPHFIKYYQNKQFDL